MLGTHGDPWLSVGVEWHGVALECGSVLLVFTRSHSALGVSSSSPVMCVFVFLMHGTLSE